MLGILSVRSNSVASRLPGFIIEIQCEIDVDIKMLVRHYKDFSKKVNACTVLFLPCYTYLRTNLKSMNERKIPPIVTVTQNPYELMECMMESVPSIAP